MIWPFYVVVGLILHSRAKRSTAMCRKRSRRGHGVWERDGTRTRTEISFSTSSRWGYGVCCALDTRNGCGNGCGTDPLGSTQGTEAHGPTYYLLICSVVEGPTDPLDRGPPVLALLDNRDDDSLDVVVTATRESPRRYNNLDGSGESKFATKSRILCHLSKSHGLE